MTRIDFYQIDTNEPMLLFACRLIDKAWRQGHQIYAYSNDEATAAGSTTCCGPLDPTGLCHTLE